MSAIKVLWVRNAAQLHAIREAFQDIPSQAVPVIRLADLAEVRAELKELAVCICQHSNPYSSQEWDRTHEAWCPHTKAHRLLARLPKEGAA